MKKISFAVAVLLGYAKAQDAAAPADAAGPDNMPDHLSNPKAMYNHYV